jgi:hypothetical protein
VAQEASEREPIEKAKERDETTNGDKAVRDSCTVKAMESRLIDKWGATSSSQWTSHPDNGGDEEMTRRNQTMH